MAKAAGKMVPSWATDEAVPKAAPTEQERPSWDVLAELFQGSLTEGAQMGVNVVRNPNTKVPHLSIYKVGNNGNPYGTRTFAPIARAMDVLGGAVAAYLEDVLGQAGAKAALHSLFTEARAKATGNASASPLAAKKA